MGCILHYLFNLNTMNGQETKLPDFNYHLKPQMRSILQWHTMRTCNS